MAEPGRGSAMPRRDPSIPYGVGHPPMGTHRDPIRCMPLGGPIPNGMGPSQPLRIPIGPFRSAHRACAHGTGIAAPMRLRSVIPHDFPAFRQLIN